MRRLVSTQRSTPEVCALVGTGQARRVGILERAEHPTHGASVTPHNEPWRSAYWKRAQKDIDAMRGWLRRATEADVRRMGEVLADRAGATGETRSLVLLVLLERWREAKRTHRGETGRRKDG